jgi:hypothetical protein
MKNKLKLLSGLVLSFAATGAFAEPIWVPIPPLIVGPPPVVRTGTPTHVMTTGNTLSIALPGQLQYDEFGRVVNKLQRITHFEVVVGPGSTDRGCYPASKADGLRNWTGVVSPWKNISATTKVDTYERKLPGEARKWTVHQFEVNGGTETPVSQLNIFFPADKRRIVECHFQVNVTSSDDEDAAAATTRSAESAPATSALAAPAAASAKKGLPRIEDVPAQQEE